MHRVTAGLGLIALAAVGCLDESAPDLVVDDVLDTAVSGPVELYPAGRRHSPLTPTIVARLQMIAGSSEMQDDVFAKVGASSTKSRSFLHCFAGDNVDLDGRDELQSTIDVFRGGDAEGTSPFQRQSLTTTVGWHAGCALNGPPCASRWNPTPVERPLEEELAAIAPRFAIVQYGTNDIQLRNIDRYGEYMFTIADTLIERGVIPIMGSIMPRDDSAWADAQVPLYNLVARGIAQSRQVPFTDFHRELLPLDDHGLSGDGIHPSTSGGGCVLTEDGLRAGYNIRNLITIEALDQLRRSVLGTEAAPDASQTVIRGAGTAADPRVISDLPFTDVRDTTEVASRAIDTYPGCAANQDESGAEVLYRLDLESTIAIRAVVVSRAGVDVDIHLLEAPNGDACLERSDKDLSAELGPGTYYLSVDTFVASGDEKAGEFLLAVMPVTAD